MVLLSLIPKRLQRNSPTVFTEALRTPANRPTALRAGCLTLALLSDAANGAHILREDVETVGSLVPGIMPRKRAFPRFPIGNSFQKGNRRTAFLATCTETPLRPAPALTDRRGFRARTANVRGPQPRFARRYKPRFCARCAHPLVPKGFWLQAATAIGEQRGVWQS